MTIIQNAKWCAPHEITGETNTLTATINGVSLVIPKDSANRHYQEIQEWVAEGNKIEDAE